MGPKVHGISPADGNVSCRYFRCARGKFDIVAVVTELVQFAVKSGDFELRRRL